jgi:dihydroorotate dehydrogenase (NAD+) catalytic subunit
MVYEASRAFRISILKMGGIITPEAAVEFLLIDATPVQVGTASYAAPRATERLATALESWCRAYKI